MKGFVPKLANVLSHDLYRRAEELRSFSKQRRARQPRPDKMEENQPLAFSTLSEYYSQWQAAICYKHIQLMHMAGKLNVKRLPTMVLRHLELHKSTIDKANITTGLLTLRIHHPA